MKDKRGFFGVVMFNPKNTNNWGSMMRTAALLEVDFLATIGCRFPRQSSDTLKAWRHVPIFHFKDFDDFYEHLPHACRLIGVELSEDAIDLSIFKHPERACYILGAEDHGIPDYILKKCHAVVKLRGKFSMNVACAGSIVMYHRAALDKEAA